MRRHALCLRLIHEISQAGHIVAAKPGDRTGLSLSAQARIILCAAATRYLAAEKREQEQP